MQLIFKIKKAKQKGLVSVEIVLKKKGRIIGKETVENADKALEGLDKILKKSKIGITNIGGIKVVDFSKNRYTSYRIIKAVEKALKFSLNLS